VIGAMVEWSRNTQWRQGSLLSLSAIEGLELSHPDQGLEVVVIVASHDCDISQNAAIEPFVEVMVGRVLGTEQTSIDGNHTHAKNPRTLHIILAGETNKYAEVVSTDKQCVSKKELVKYKPEKHFHLGAESRVIFQRWLASRYRRSAFSDEFENRLKNNKLHQKIANAMKKTGDHIVAVFFDVDEGKEVLRTELQDCYCLDIVILYSTSTDANAALLAASEAKSTIETAFKNKLYDENTDQWHEIELRYVDAISDEALTYKQSTLMKQWRLDYISLQADPQQAILEE